MHLCIRRLESMVHVVNDLYLRLHVQECTDQYVNCFEFPCFVSLLFEYLLIVSLMLIVFVNYVQHEVII